MYIYGKNDFSEYIVSFMILWHQLISFVEVFMLE